MGLLESVRKGRRPMPPRLVLYGTEGIGKSTFGAQTPAPIFVQTEDGLGEIDCHRFPLAQSFEEVIEDLAAIHKEPHDYQTVVLDSLDWLERLIWDEVCAEYGVKSIEKADGGYAKGYTHALTPWREVLNRLDALRANRGMVVILIAHAKVEKFEDPESAAYDRYSPRLHKHATALVTEWADAVLFATRKFRTETEDAGFNRTRAVATPLGKDGGERIIRTVGSPACIAKNRYSLPAELPLSWSALIGAMTVAAGQEGTDRAQP
ncbi:MAG: ATP-binding protein [Planctomycetota bacterium]|nr:ATP-binding protein [Planctomycetota bacterium]